MKRRMLLTGSATLLGGLLTGCNSQTVRQMGEAAIQQMQRQQQGAPTIAEQKAAIRQALAQGVKEAIARLGRKDGFLHHPRYHIPLPDTLNRMSGTLRQLGLGQYVTQYETTLNRAAERAVPEAADVFARMVEGLTIEDAVRLLRGGETAVTDYFRRTQDAALRQRFMPIVRQAMREAGVTRAYEQLQQRLNGLGIRLEDAGTHVVNAALQALYSEMAREERAIRHDPIRRTTTLLKKVFGWYAPT